MYLILTCSSLSISPGTCTFYSTKHLQVHFFQCINQHLRYKQLTPLLTHPTFLNQSLSRFTWSLQFLTQSTLHLSSQILLTSPTDDYKHQIPVRTQFISSIGIVEASQTSFPSFNPSYTAPLFTSLLFWDLVIWQNLQQRFWPISATISSKSDRHTRGGGVLTNLWDCLWVDLRSIVLYWNIKSQSKSENGEWEVRQDQSISGRLKSPRNNDILVMSHNGRQGTDTRWEVSQGYKREECMDAASEVW